MSDDYAGVGVPDFGLLTVQQSSFDGMSKEAVEFVVQTTGDVPRFGLMPEQHGVVGLERMPVSVWTHDRPTKAELRVRLNAYLSERHTTLWLDWDISNPPRREKAIDFIVDLCCSLGLVCDA